MESIFLGSRDDYPLVLRAAAVLESSGSSALSKNDWSSLATEADRFLAEVDLMRRKHFGKAEVVIMIRKAVKLLGVGVSLLGALNFAAGSALTIGWVQLGAGTGWPASAAIAGLVGTHAAQFMILGAIAFLAGIFVYYAADASSKTYLRSAHPQLTASREKILKEVDRIPDRRVVQAAVAAVARIDQVISASREESF
jgi:hypothetical protein